MSREREEQEQTALEDRLGYLADTQPGAFVALLLLDVMTPAEHDAAGAALDYLERAERLAEKHAAADRRLEALTALWMTSPVQHPNIGPKFTRGDK